MEFDSVAGIWWWGGCDLGVEGGVTSEAGEPVLEGLDAAGDLGGVEPVASSA